MSTEISWLLKEQKGAVRIKAQFKTFPAALHWTEDVLVSAGSKLRSAIPWILLLFPSPSFPVLFPIRDAAHLFVRDLHPRIVQHIWVLHGCIDTARMDSCWFID